MEKDNLVIKGLTGLARAGETTWFDGHFGAAALVADRLLKRDDFSLEVKAGFHNQLGFVFRDHSDLFSPFNEEEPNRILEERILEAIKKNLSSLSLSGHGVIYGAIALTALKEHPEYMQAPIVDGIVKLLHRTLVDRPNRYFGIPDYKAKTAPSGEAIPRYDDVKAMIKTTFLESREIYADGYVGDAFYFFAAEKLHALTHAHALSTLDGLGYRELAQMGFEAHRKQLQLNRMVPPDPKWTKKVAPQGLTPFQATYWERDHFDDHSLKLACAVLELLDKFDGDEIAGFYNATMFWEPFMR